MKMIYCECVVTRHADRTMKESKAEVHDYALGTETADMHESLFDISCVSGASNNVKRMGYSRRRKFATNRPALYLQIFATQARFISLAFPRPMIASCAFDATHEAKSCQASGT